MTLPAKKPRAAAGADAYVPDQSKGYGWQKQKRRRVEAIEALPLRWPANPKQRFDLFDTWHDVAMQLLRQARVGLHVACAAKKVTEWANGTITSSNAELASRSGYPSEKTISREVQAYIALGLFIPKFEWRRPDGRKFITVRTLRLSLPRHLPDGIILPGGKPVSLDTSGPDLSAVSLDTSGPDPLDTSGPATINHKKGAGDVSA